MVCSCEIYISASNINHKLNTCISIHIETLIPYYYISHPRLYDQGSEKNINTLMKYMKMVLTDIKDQVIQKSLSTAEILIHPLTVF